MNIDFVFFQNQDMLQEIYKHKWIESEKAGREIGLASAAWDWMTRYHNDWEACRNLRLEKSNPWVLHR